MKINLFTAAKNVDEARTELVDKFWDIYQPWLDREGHARKDCFYVSPNEKFRSRTLKEACFFDGLIRDFNGDEDKAKEEYKKLREEVEYINQDDDDDDDDDKDDDYVPEGMQDEENEDEENEDEENEDEENEDEENEGEEMEEEENEDDENEDDENEDDENEDEEMEDEEKDDEKKDDEKKDDEEEGFFAMWI